MLFKSTISAALVGGLIAASATAGGHTSTEQRIAAMKAIGGEMRTLGGMARGTVDYDAATALAALEVMRNSAMVAQPLFAEPTPDGEETRAMDAIWADGSDFDERMSTLVAALDAAVAAEPADAATFGPLFGAVAGTCQGCHENYRAPEN